MDKERALIARNIEDYVILLFSCTGKQQYVERVNSFPGKNKREGQDQAVLVLSLAPCVFKIKLLYLLAYSWNLFSQ